MKQMPKVYFGTVKGPVDWRSMNDDFDPDDEEMDETPDFITGILGFDPKENVTKGGGGSGNFGHAGIPGHLGGSASLASRMKSIGISSIIKGDVGSGNFGHAGRPGEVGGSGGGSRNAPSGNVPGGNMQTNISQSAVKILGDNLHIEDGDSAIVNQHLTELSRFPLDILQNLKEKGVNIYLANKSVPEMDHNGDKRGVRPVGWPEGKTYDVVPGIFNLKDNSVSAGRGNHGCASLVGHETGHAIFLRVLTKGQRKEIAELHKKYYSTMRPYYQQGGPGNYRGTDELFAETISGIIARNTTRPPSTNVDCMRDMNTMLRKWRIML